MKQRTIKQSLFSRLYAQASEADLQGLTKVAEALTDQIENNATLVRDNVASYDYPEESFKKDVQDSLWNAVIRTADYYNFNKFNAEKIQEMIERTAEEMIQELCIQAGVDSAVGAYDQNVPGQEQSNVLIEVEE